MSPIKILSLIALMFSLITTPGCNESIEKSIPVNSVSSAYVHSLEYEEGSSMRDEIVNTSSAEKVLLVISFGTSFNQSRYATIGGIETALQEAYPDYQVRRAFTSQIIIDKLAKRESLIIDNVTEAMDRLILDKVKEVIIQPTTIMNGYEYDDLLAEIQPYIGKFTSLKIGKWLLADAEDFQIVADIIVAETASLRAADTALVFMGHGTEHEANVIYTKLQEMLWANNYDDYLIGTVEAEPDLEAILEALKVKDIKKVILRPLMIVAGDHANNDMAGDEEDSWKIILAEEGYQVETIIEGLGQIKGIQDLFSKHVQEASALLAPTTESAHQPKGLASNRLNDGSYQLEVATDASMFRIVACEVNIVDGLIMATIKLSGQGYGSVYLGSKEEAEADEAKQIQAVLNDDGNTFVLPLTMLDSEISLAALGTKSGTWYDHTVIFKSTNLPATAYKVNQIDVSLEGGSGKATLKSPALLTYKEGTNIATVEWSSANYTYMIIDDIKYLPLEGDGNSTFEFPIVFDQKMKIIACTVAMSEPREIEYSLFFDSSSVK